MSASGLEERIGALLAQHREELEQLVDQAIERELATVVEQRLAARNGGPAPTAAPIPYKQLGNTPAATKVCDSCGETKPEAAFEKYRRRCRECRRRDRRTAAAESQAEPGRPATIDPDELRERARVDDRAPPRDLDDWLVGQGFAEREGGQLVPTAAAKVGEWIAPLGG